MPFVSDDQSPGASDAFHGALSDSIEALLAGVTAADSPNLPLYREMLATVACMAQADRSRWDAKILLQTMREMERAFGQLQRFRHRRKVTVFGSARTPIEHPLYAQARTLGAALARNDMMVITGAGGGIMGAAHEGAGLQHSLGLNITLPFEQHANPVVDGTDHLLSFHFFFVRKLFFIKEADALVLCPGGFGTLDETMEVLTLIQTGKSPLVPVVLLDEPGGRYWADLLAFLQRQLLDNRYILPSDLRLMHLVHDPEEATAEIARFYANFHSSRWDRDHFIIRLRHRLSDAALSVLQTRFADLCAANGYTQKARADNGRDEPTLAALPRLEFMFTGRNQGRLRELVDFVNQREHWVT